jgi:hypothetical protein
MVRDKLSLIVGNLLIQIKFNYMSMGFSNMCKIAHVKVTKNSNYLLRNTNYLFKSYTFNKKCTSSHTNLLF